MSIHLICEQVIGAAFRVHNQLGFGFLESVYENALKVELNDLRINYKCQQALQVIYRNEVVGDFIADILIENCLILELKSVQKLNIKHEVQLVNYLKATGIHDGLLINFGADKVEIKHKYLKPISK